MVYFYAVLSIILAVSRFLVDPNIAAYQAISHIWVGVLIGKKRWYLLAFVTIIEVIAFILTKKGLLHHGS